MVGGLIHTLLIHLEELYTSLKTMLQWETGAVSVLLFLGSMNGTDERCRELMTRAYAAALALQDLVGGKVESLFVRQSERRKGNFLVPKKRREMETSITFSVQPTTPACLDPKTIKPRRTNRQLL